MGTWGLLATCWKKSYVRKCGLWSVPVIRLKWIVFFCRKFAIVSAAIRGIPGMKACDVEFSMSKPSYTVDTLRVLFDRYPGRRFALIIGGDNVPDFPKWKDYHWIEVHCSIFVYPRPGIVISAEESTSMTFIDAPLFPLSATEIREMIRKGDDISSLVPNEALSLIWKLYSK